MTMPLPSVKYMIYQPKFTISNEILTLVSDISLLVGRIRDDDMPIRDLKLRRENRIRSIHSSLAIEGNTLSLDKVTDIIDGKHVIGTAREIQEVKGAAAAYDMIDSLDPHSIDDLLKAHSAMTQDLVERPGAFRDCNVGVFKGPEAVHIAPEHEDVPRMIDELIEWSERTDQHPLIKSCVFHCRFEYIHPFVDGNGRMGRLWHSLILSRWNPVFVYLPVETGVRSNQRDYYAALNESDKSDMTEFIRFMLQMIKMAMDEFVDEAEYSGRKNVSEKERTILNLILKDPKVTAATIAEVMGVSSRTAKRYLSMLLEKGLISRMGSDKTGHWEVL